MLVEKTTVKVGDTPVEKCPVYDKQTAQTVTDAFSVLNITLTPELRSAIATFDGYFPDLLVKGKDGKEETIGSPIRSLFLGHFNYGFDLYQKAKARRDFEKTLEDPSKPVVGAVKAMITAGFDADTSYDLVAAQRSAKGMETPAKDVILAKLK